MTKPLQLKKQIYKKMYLLTTISVVLTTLMLLLGFYFVFDNQMRNDVKVKATFFEKSLNYSADNIDYVTSLKLSNDDARITIINPNGSIAFDSYKPSNSLENHLNRPEIKSAFLTNMGEAKRHSETLGEQTYYYAVKLNDDTVLRIAQTSDSLYEVFVTMFPVIIVIVILIYLLCNLITIKLTKKIIEPINKIDLANENPQTYDELAPFIHTILSQKQQLNSQLGVLENHATTITAITKSMSEGLILLDSKQNIISINESAFTIFDVPPHDLTQKNIVEFTRNSDILDSINEISYGKNTSKILELNKKFYNMIASPVYMGETLTGAVVILLDVTQKLNAEKLRREFSANVSHELKTPLTTISGYAEMINTGMAKNDDIENFSGKIKDEATRLLFLIEDIIRLSELDETTQKLSFERFNLLDLANKVSNSLAPFAKERNVSINTSGEDFIINANKTMINELLQNLIDNAIKYNKEMGKVLVSIKKQNKNAIITVSDSGIGIPSAYQSRVFERFFRVDKSRSKKTGGTGLGLAIVKHIAQLHNGSVALESRASIGTTITVTIETGEE